MKTAILLLFSVMLFTGCKNLYKAGNLVILDYSVATPLKTELVSKYIDTLILTKGFEVPDKWKHLDKLVGLDSVHHKRIYFQSNPEEMYLISYAGMLRLSDVYNPQLNANDWVSVREQMPLSEEQRIKKRFQKVLDEIEGMAHQDNLPDSIIYK